MFHRNFHPCDLTTVHYSTSTSTPCDVWSFTNSVWPPMYLYMYIPMYSNNNNDNNMSRGGPVAYSCLFYRRARTLRCPDGVGTLRIEGFVSSSVGDLKNKPVGKKSRVGVRPKSCGSKRVLLGIVGGNSGWPASRGRL